MNSQDEELLKIVERLKEMPKIEDERTKDEIYSIVMEKMAEKNTRKKSRYYMSFIAASVAVILFMTFIPSLLQERNEIGMKESETSHEDNSIIEEGNIFVEGNAINENHKFYMVALKENDLLDGYSAVTIPYPAPSSTFNVPLSFAIFTEEDVLQGVKQLMNQFDPSFFGLEDTLLKKVDLSEEDESELVVHIQESEYAELESDFDRFLQSIEIFANSLKYDHVKIDVDDKTLEQQLTEGDVSTEKAYSYYIYETSTNHFMLVPIEVDGLNFSETLEKMKEAPNDWLQPVIQDNVTFYVEERDRHAFVRIEGAKTNDAQAFHAMIEAILLVAKHYSFDYVEFSGVDLQEKKHSTMLAPNGM